ncbi:UNKNOWN [Stylonychia lemnae]|uniref:Uncharacterized protein n=1 Tax=Stylonychia lemnae TaxID=5949 RepID=A0A078ABU7_STYLE|nr:UNKNOWN [Stylonychia lemnae]|eukprot:CDW79664.1 UNKNOWN [Stylonychia lemnae]
MENQEQSLEEVKEAINQEEQEPENITDSQMQSQKDSESEQQNQSQLDNSNEQIDIKMAKELMDHQILPPVFIIQAKLSWFQRLQSFKEQQGSTNETTQAKNQVEVLEENQKIKILEKYSHLALKDLSKCTREIIHNYFACILKNSDKMCLLEKIFYDQFMKIYPCHNKSQIKLKEYPRLTQSCKSFETLQQQLREHMKKQGDQPMNESVDIKSFSQQISDHECQGYQQKPHSFSHRVCQKGYKEIRENSLNNLIDLKYIQNWIYMHENLARLFESAVETEFREDDIPINKPDKQKIHPITKGFYEKYSQLSEFVKQQKEKLSKSSTVQNELQNKQPNCKIASFKNLEESKESNGSYTRTYRNIDSNKNTDELLNYIASKTMGEDMIKLQSKIQQFKQTQKAIFSVQNDFRNKDHLPQRQSAKSEEECPYPETMEVDFNGNQDLGVITDQSQALEEGYRIFLRACILVVTLIKSSKIPSDQVIDTLMSIMDEYAGKLLQQNQQKQNEA